MITTLKEEQELELHSGYFPRWVLKFIFLCKGGVKIYRVSGPGSSTGGGEDIFSKKKWGEDFLYWSRGLRVFFEKN